jgi:hypothetical protein
VLLGIVVVAALESGSIDTISLPGGAGITFRSVAQPLPTEIASSAKPDAVPTQIPRQPTAAPASAQVAAPPLNLTGRWTSPNGLSYVITHDGSDVEIQEWSPIYGLTAVGEGTINGDSIAFEYETTVGTGGRGSLRVGSGGRQLNGSITDTLSGFSQAMSLQR